MRFKCDTSIIAAVERSAEEVAGVIDGMTGEAAEAIEGQLEKEK